MHGISTLHFHNNYNHNLPFLRVFVLADDEINVKAREAYPALPLHPRTNSLDFSHLLVYVYFKGQEQ
jgi:hypothetical protein